MSPWHIVAPLLLFEGLIYIRCEVKYLSTFRGFPHHTIPTNGVEDYYIYARDKPKCKLGNKRYYVKKVLAENTINKYKFHASLDKEFIKEPHKEGIEQYEHRGEIGYIYCGIAFMYKLVVKEHARQCGIGPALSLLCMTDADVNPGNEINLDNLEERFEYREDIIARIKQDCQKVFALFQYVTVKEGANSYFSAAKKADYQFFIIKDERIDEFHYMKVEDAQRQYNDNGYNFPGCSRAWFFCKKK